MFRFMRVPVAACLAVVLVLAGRTTSIAYAIPSDPVMPTYGQVIALVNHTNDQIAALNFPAIPSSSIVIVDLSADPFIPPNPVRPALTNAVQRNASGIAALQQALGAITVTSSGGSCSAEFVCPSMGSYLAAQGFALTSVISIVPPSSTTPSERLILYTIPPNPVIPPNPI